MSMPTVECPKCEHLVSIIADYCPGCESTLTAQELRLAWEKAIHGWPLLKT